MSIQLIITYASTATYIAEISIKLELDRNQSKNIHHNSICYVNLGHFIFFIGMKNIDFVISFFLSQFFHF